MQLEATVLWHNQKDSWLSSEKLSVSGDEVVVDALYSLISLGTERLVSTQPLTGSLADNMRVPYMSGYFDENFTYGYSVVGRLRSSNKDIDNRLVHVMHPHQDKLVVRADDLCFLPEGMCPTRATLISNMETAVNAIWDAQLEMGDKVLIAGYGTVGALIASICLQMPGIDVEVCETDKQRQSIIRNVGISVFDEDAFSEGDDFDVVFNTTCDESVLNTAFEVSKLEGRIVELSWYGIRTSLLSLGKSFHYGRKRIVSSQVSHIPKRKQPDWDYSKRKTLCINLLMELKLAHLITKEIHFNEAPVFYKNLRKGNIDCLGVVIKY